MILIVELGQPNTLLTFFSLSKFSNEIKEGI